MRAAFTPTDPEAQAASQSPAVTLKVTRARATVTAKLAKKRVTLPDRARLKVAISGPARPTGRITVVDNVRKLATAKVVGSTARLVLPKLRAGKHRIVVRFSGNGLLLGAASAPQVLTVVRR